MAQPPFNPYAPPQTPDVALPDLAFGDFDIARTINDAWDAVKRHFPLWLGVGFIAYLLTMVSVITCIGCFVAAPVLVWGVIKFLLNMIDNRPTFDDLFHGFRNYLAVLGRTLLLGLTLIVMLFLSESVVFVGQYIESDWLEIVGWVACVVFFLAVFLRLYFSFFLVVDRNMGAFASLAGSWRMTEGKTLKVIGLAFLMWLVAVSGLIACVVGAVVTVTMSSLMVASAYRQMAGPPAPSPMPTW
jgi:hypothetical protein